MKTYRVAFVTNEFVVENPSSGGLASYLYRMACALRDLGHEPEMFVQQRHPDTPAVMNLNGIRVQHVAPRRGRIFKLCRFVERRMLASPWDGATGYVAAAWSLARALELRHAQRPFDLVQSASVGATGLFVRRSRSRVHVVRVSSGRRLLFALEGLDTPGGRLMGWLEELVMGRGDRAYAPSRYIADYCRVRGNPEVEVLRPPFMVPAEPYGEPPESIVSPYLIHFGRMGVVKGTDVLARALLLAWQDEPDLRVVLAGRMSVGGAYESFCKLWGSKARNVVWAGAVERPVLYALVKGALASVLPSRIDNLPNTVIESLMLGVPVIGSAGASIDELVEPGVNGELVPIGDERALAQTMVRAWRGELRYADPSEWRAKLLRDGSPRAAAERLLTFADAAVGGQDGV